mgnify:CR=1 FL=1
MDRSDWEADELFFAALEIDDREARGAFLVASCGRDSELLHRVERLLAANSRVGRFLVPPADMETATYSSAALVEGQGTVIGPYKLLETIGQGGMGVVYLAEQIEPVRRKVALKVIKPGMDTRQVLARFEAERQALAMMDHPNIARVLDADATDSGRPYFVMELVQGVKITEFCDREELTLPERLDLFVLVCRAVQHAHQKGVIHRDLKPSNILVTVSDDAPAPKVIDFGIAKATGSRLTDKTLFTGLTQMIGTPTYMSPEQAELTGTDVDTRSDIYSLGVLLYELLTGTTPLDGDALRKASFDEMRRIIREDGPPRPSERVSTLEETLSNVSAKRRTDAGRHGPSLRGELDWIVMKALEKDRSRRYQTANDFAADVMRYLTDQAVEACPPSWLYRFKKTARRNRVALTTSGLVLMALVAGLAASSWQAFRATRAERRTVSALETAEERLRLARQTVDEMYTQVAEKWLAQQPRLTTVQREFLEKALAHYQRFASDPATGPRGQRDVAEALLKVGRIRLALGEYEQARSASLHAQKLWKELAASDPGRPEYRKGFAYANVDVGIVTNRLGKPREAEPHYLQAVETLTALSTDAPAIVEYRVNLANALTNLAGAFASCSRASEAEAASRKALELKQSMATAAPRNEEFSASLAGEHFHLGTMLIGLNRSAEAEAHFRKAQDLQRKLESDQPDNPDHRDALAATFQYLGHLQQDNHQQQAAEESYREALARRQALAAGFPTVIKHLAQFALVLNDLGVLMQENSRLPEAESYFQQALQVQEKLAADHPTVPVHRHEVGGTRNNLAMVAIKRGDLQKGRRLLDEAVEDQKAVLKINPEHPDSLRYLRNHYVLLGEVVVGGGDHGEARRLAELIADGNFPDDPGETGGSKARAARLLAACVPLVERDPALSTQERDSTVSSIVQRARGLVQQAARRATNSPGVLHALAELLTTTPVPDLRDAALACDLARRETEIDSRNAAAWRIVALAESRKGNHDAAYEAIAKCLELQGGGCEYDWLVLGLAAANSGEDTTARRSLDRAVQMIESGAAKPHAHGPVIGILRAELEGRLGIKPSDGGAPRESSPGASTPP